MLFAQVIAGHAHCDALDRKRYRCIKYIHVANNESKQGTIVDSLNHNLLVEFLQSLISSGTEIEFMFRLCYVYDIFCDYGANKTPEEQYFEAFRSSRKWKLMIRVS